MSDLPASRPRPERRVLLAVLGLFLFTLPALFALMAEQTLFNPQVYKEELNNLDFYQRYPAILGETLSESSDTLLPGVGAQLLNLMTATNYEDLVRLLFPRDWVQEQAESLIDQFWSYYNFETPALRLVVDFSEIKTRLQNNPDLRVVQIVVQSLPVCTETDIINIGLLALQGKLNEAPLCRPPDQFIEITNTVVAELLRGAGGLAPGQVDLSGLLRLPSALSGAPQPAEPGLSFRAYRLFRTVGPWLLLGSLICLVLVVIWGRATARGALFWSGAGLLLPGFSALLIAFILAAGSGQTAELLVGRLFLADLPVFDVLVGLVQAVGSRFFMWSGAAGLGLALVGIGLILIGYLLNFPLSRSQVQDPS